MYLLKYAEVILVSAVRRLPSIFLDDECFFELNLNYRFTMSCKHGDWWYPVEILPNGTIHQAENNFYGKNYTDDPTLQDFPDELYEPKEFEEKNCVFGNGEKTGMITINDQAPPAPLEVIEGALVHVRVNNYLGGGISTSLHFHGFKMDKERLILALVLDTAPTKSPTLAQKNHRLGLLLV